ncbi:hypothetical protein CYMTET_15599 [Cymbomonas tetramitiformis]|uniref:14-3-3 domain-containing protein n=1 Tax=Cymbomonas tetramitiformis TaxID=36881 RepID=A0AAE0L8R9_9CHLO|nr:hypothetical protein CYMTET_15599 [Cymbomonas tetramitiformis]
MRGAFEFADSREGLVYHARLSEQAERFDDMAAFMRRVAELRTELTVEERNLFSVAFKNSIGSRRSCWRVLNTESTRVAHQRTDLNKAKFLERYKDAVEIELTDLCYEVLDILDDYLLPHAKTSESKVFYYKLKGDYCRYLSEIKQNPGQRKEAAEGALDAYREASELGSRTLAPTDPIRLGLALNFAVFFYEILDSPERACSLAKLAFDEAVVELNTLSEDAYKDSTLLMQILRDNLTLWKREIHFEDE